MADENSSNDESFWDSAASIVTAGAEEVAGLAEDEVGSVIGVGSHAVGAVADAVEGDWDGAAHEAGSMSWDALNVASEGALVAGAVGWDAVNMASSGEIGSAEGDFQGGLQAAGNWLGDEAYSLLNPSEDTTGATGGQQ